LCRGSANAVQTRSVNGPNTARSAAKQHQEADSQLPELHGFNYLSSAGADGRPPLLLLHGSSRDETELLPLAAEAAPDCPFLSLRGGIDWAGGYAFFRRNDDRTLDLADLAAQTERLRMFIRAAIETGLISGPPVLLGFSNGAIIAASLLIRDPASALGAILMRPLSPAPDTPLPSMPAKTILILSGETDDRRSPEDASLVAQQFENAGANVTAHSLPTGHDLHQTEPALIRHWLEREIFPLVT
jgi:phospholipase/carboxylesterase